MLVLLLLSLVLLLYSNFSHSCIFGAVMIGYTTVFKQYNTQYPLTIYVSRRFILSLNYLCFFPCLHLIVKIKGTVDVFRRF